MPPPLSQDATFELLNLESWNSQCRKMFMRQLFWPNLGILRGKNRPKIKLLHYWT